MVGNEGINCPELGLDNVCSFLPSPVDATIQHHSSQTTIRKAESLSSLLVDPSEAPIRHLAGTSRGLSSDGTVSGVAQVSLRRAPPSTLPAGSLLGFVHKILTKSLALRALTHTPSQGAHEGT